MPRLYHSPSSTELGARCQRAWAYCYIDGLRDPEVVWREEMATALPPGMKPKQRSAALGTAAHAVLEAWYEGREPAWHTYPGQVVEAGRHLLPEPDACEDVFVEEPIGAEPIAYDVEPTDDRPRVGYRFDGVLWAGFRDLVVYAPAELRRIGIDADTALLDYKTTSSIARYSKNEAALTADLQCNLYALATMQGSKLAARWVYFETKKSRRAVPTDVRITRVQAEEIVGRAGELTRVLDAIERSADAPRNPDACGDYGGCMYHVSAGGPCDAQRSVGKLIQLSRKGNKMSVLTPEQKEKFAKFRKPTAPATDATPPTDAPPADGAAAGSTEGSGAGEITDPTPKVETTPVRTKLPKRQLSAAPAAPGGIAEVVGKAQAEIAAAEALIADGTAKRDAAVSALKAALA